MLRLHMEEPAGRHGVLLIRAWTDATSADFRVRIMRVLPEGTLGHVSYANSRQGVIDAVVAWLHEFQD